jgi:hypothetical protein
MEFHPVGTEGHDQPSAVPRYALFLLLGSGLAAVAEVVCVALFLRAVARFLGAKLLARRAGEYARFFVTFTALLFALNYFSGYLLRLAPGDPESKSRMVPVLLVVELACFLILAAQFLGLVKDTRDTVERARTNTSGPAGQVPRSGQEL